MVSMLHHLSPFHFNEKLKCKRVSDIILGMKQKYNDTNSNDKGNILVDFYTSHACRINNTCFDQSSNSIRLEQYQLTIIVIVFQIKCRHCTPNQLMDSVVQWQMQFILFDKGLEKKLNKIENLLFFIGVAGVYSPNQ